LFLAKSITRVIEICITFLKLYTASEVFRYISWRDISGRFILDTKEAMMDQKKAFVKLDLSLGMEYASDGTADDYAEQKKRFIEKNLRLEASCFLRNSAAAAFF